MSDTKIRTYSSDQRQTEEESTVENENHESFTCPECSGRVVNDEEHGESVCTECGLVVEEDSIDRGRSGARSTPTRRTARAASAPRRRT